MELWVKTPRGKHWHIPQERVPVTRALCGTPIFVVLDRTYAAPKHTHKGKYCPRCLKAMPYMHAVQIEEDGV